MIVCMRNVVFAIAVLDVAIAVGADNTWRGGSTGNWNVPGNWSLERVPQSGDKVVFPASAGDVTINVDANPTITSFEMDAASSPTRVTLTGGGTITLDGNNVTCHVRGNRTIVLEGASMVWSNSSSVEIRGTVEVKAGSVWHTKRFDNLWSAGAKFIVDGGTAQIDGALQYYETRTNSAFIVNSGTANIEVFQGNDDPNKSGYPVSVEINGGSVTFKSFKMTRAGSRLSLADGTMKVSSSGSFTVAEGVLVSLTGGTLKPNRGIYDERFWATDGATLDLSGYMLHVTNGVFTSSKGTLMANTITDSSSMRMYASFPTVVLNATGPSFSFSDSGDRNFYLTGPTAFRATCDVGAGFTNLTTYVHLSGDFTVDTRDWTDGTTPRKLGISNLVSEDGQGALTITGGGTFYLRQRMSGSSFRKIAVGNDTTLALLNWSTSEFGPTTAELFSMGTGSRLTLTAKRNFVSAEDFDIDPSARIDVTIPSSFTYGAWPILASTDGTTPDIDLSQITLSGAAEGFLVKKEKGQVTVYKTGTVSGNYLYEWVGGGSDNYLGTAANWYSGAVPYENVATIYFGASVYLSPAWSQIYKDSSRTSKGATVQSYNFLDTATGSYTYTAGGETVGNTPSVRSDSGVPQTINGNFRLYTMGAWAFGPAPLVLNGSTSYTLRSTTAGTFAPLGDIRVGHNKFLFHRLKFDTGSTITHPMPYDRMTVLSGGVVTITNQAAYLAFESAGLRVEKGGTLWFKGGRCPYGWSTLSSKHVVNGLLDLDIPLGGGMNQTYGGSGEMNIASVCPSNAATRISFADTLKVRVESDWTTVSAANDTPLALRAYGTPTLALSGNWRYGVPAGVETATPAADRAIELARGATLTIDAGGATATIGEKIAGEGSLAITNGMLNVAVVSTNSATIVVRDGGVLIAAPGLSVGAVDFAGGAVSVAGISGSTGWKTVCEADSFSGEPLIPSRTKMRYVDVSGKRILQLRYIRGYIISFR